MSKRLIANTLATSAGVFTAAVTIYFSYTKLREPQIALDWAALILSGLTTGIIASVVIWGHFQSDPVPPIPADESKGAT